MGPRAGWRPGVRPWTLNILTCLVKLVQMEIGWRLIALYTVIGATWGGLGGFKWKSFGAGWHFMQHLGQNSIDSPGVISLNKNLPLPLLGVVASAPKVQHGKSRFLVAGSKRRNRPWSPCPIMSQTQEEPDMSLIPTLYPALWSGPATHCGRRARRQKMPTKTKIILCLPLRTAGSALAIALAIYLYYC